MSRSADRITQTIDRLKANFEASAYYPAYQAYEEGVPEAKDDILLSVIIPARNEFPNIVHTIHSILNCWEADGFDPLDIEIIVVNNCSTDYNDPKYDYSKPGDRGTTEHLMPRGVYHSRIMRVHYDPIAGNHSARNKGAKIARGKYLFFSDAHMSYKPGAFKYGLQAVKESGGIVHCAIAWMGGYPAHPTSLGMQYTIKLGEEWKGCVDEETEILTRAGWRTHETVRMDDEFATLSVGSQLIEFQKASEIVKRQHDGEMVHFKGRSINQLLTPYHRSLYAGEYDKHWSVKEAVSVGSHDRIPIASGGVNSIYDDECNTRVKNDMVSLLGWIITEGCYSKRKVYHGKAQNPTITITQFKENGRVKIESLLHALGISYCIHGKKRDFKIHQRHSAEIMKLLPEKKLTVPFLYTLTNAQRSLLYEALVDGDGHRAKTSVHFYQSCKETAEAFQVLCTLLGNASSLTTRSNIGSYGKKQKYVVSVKKNRYASDFSREKVKYKGVVWCPDTPNGTIIIRRSGIVSLSGNTWANYRPWNDKWFYIAAQGHCSLFVNRKQFLDFGGYPDIHRTYGGGEFFTNMLWWMYGSTVAVEPRAVGYHLASSRGYTYAHDDYIHNVYNCAYALGCDDWLERTHLNYLRRGREQVLEHMLAEAKIEMADRRTEVEQRRITTFNDLLVDRPWDKLNMERGGAANSSLLIYHYTWIHGLKDYPKIKERFEKSETQKKLSEFIETKLHDYIYKWQEYEGKVKNS